MRCVRPVWQDLGRGALLVAALLPGAVVAAENDPAASEKALTNDTAADLRAEADAQVLAEIVKDQAALLDAVNQDPETVRLPQAEKERRVVELMQRYEALLARRPRDGELMILYGKFLRLVDAREKANTWFEKADALLPGQAVIKHQLGAYAAEEGKYTRALGLLEAATALAPQVAAYHYHFGEFLATYQAHLVRDGLLTRAACDAKMQEAFLRATELNPGETGYRWRYAESFFDCEKPDWLRALVAWNSLAAEATTPLERETLGLYRARVLIGLGERAEAEQLLAASKTPQLEGTRARLRELLRPKVTPLATPTAPPPP